MEGGFNGRTNKLVGGCYSWYVGASIALVSQLREVGERGEGEWERAPLWDREKLLQYILYMTQVSTGGLRDKPDMRSDLYHTMYCLCGLSLVGGVLKVRLGRGCQT